MEEEFIDNDKQLTIKGLISSNIQEIHSLAIGEFIYENRFNNLEVEELVATLSIFTNIKLSDQNRIYNRLHINCNNNIKDKIGNIQKKLDKYYDIETKNKQALTGDYTIHFDLVEFMYKWCFAEK